MEIKINFRDKYEYSISCYQDAQRNYVMSHRSLKNAFMDAYRKCPDIKIEKKVIDTSITHCIAQVQIMADGYRSIPFTGEVTTRALNDFTKNTPYVIAENRAFDKAIMDFFNLQEHVYSEDGVPVLYSDCGLNPVNLTAVQTAIQEQQPSSGLTEEEVSELRAEYAAIGDRQLTVGGKVTTFNQCTDETLEQLIAFQSNDPQIGVLQGLAVRFLELRRMGL